MGRKIWGRIFCGSAAAHSGKPLAYRRAHRNIKRLCLRVESGGIASLRILGLRKAGGFPQCAAAEPPQLPARQIGAPKVKHPPSRCFTNELIWRLAFWATLPRPGRLPPRRRHQHRCHRRRRSRSPQRRGPEAAATAPLHRGCPGILPAPRVESHR